MAETQPHTGMELGYVDDLVTWLRQQLDDDERVARQLIDSSGGFYLEAETDDTDLMAAGGHVFRWSPARVLAEVDAKRRIIEWCVAAQDRMSPPAPLVGMNVLAALALPYADRPGYREEWRP